MLKVRCNNAPDKKSEISTSVTVVLQKFCQLYKFTFSSGELDYFI